MVILQFNKLIRNKWIWGAFAVVVCLAFCFDDFFRGSRDGEENTETKAWGTLGGEPVDGKLYAQCREDIEFWLRYDRREAETDVNLQAWKLYAAQKVADNGKRREVHLRQGDRELRQGGNRFLQRLFRLGRGDEP